MTELLTELQQKLQDVRELLKEQGAQALRLKGADWFSWMTCGASNVVILTSESGVAEVLVTLDNCFVLTTEIESTRLSEEELPAGFQIKTAAWYTLQGLDRLAHNIVEDAKTLSDRPHGKEHPLNFSFLQLRLVLGADELQRYRQLGKDTAQAMSEALLEAKPEWSEQDLAGTAAEALLSKGIHPTLVLVAGESRLPSRRHPVPTKAKLEKRAMMVFCARRHGLYANLTRFVSFRPPTDHEKENEKLVAEIEAEAFASTTLGGSLTNSFERICTRYRNLDLENQIPLQHFGGLTGYLSREIVAQPGLTENFQFKAGNVFAWNPTLPGAKIEDTVLLTKEGLEILTIDKNWPTENQFGRPRPAVLVTS